MDTYGKLATQIIKDQSVIIGPVASTIAGRVNGLVIDGAEIKFNIDPKQVLQNLVIEYKNVFGDASVEICKESVHSIDVNLTKEELPEILK
ncbi:MAG: hypothetical protein U0525_04350 [Patescibacteria group bacterium]